MERTGGAEEAKPRGRIDRLQQRMERERESYADRGRVFRVAWVLAAVIVLVAGIAMMVFPGPAFIVIPIGLAMLSFEFAWAGWVLDTGLEHGQVAANKVSGASRRTQILLGVAVLAGIACLGAIGYFVFVA